METDELEPSEEPAGTAGGEGPSKLWLGVLLFGFFSLVGLTTLGALMRVSSLKAETLTRAMIQAAEPLCAAIDSYARQQGRAPRSLELLVPDFTPELPPLRPKDDPGFEYQAGEEALWTLTIWGGGFEYTRTSIDQPWFISADHDGAYPRDSWLPIE